MGHTEKYPSPAGPGLAQCMHCGNMGATKVPVQVGQVGKVDICVEDRADPSVDWLVGGFGCELFS